MIYHDGQRPKCTHRRMLSMTPELAETIERLAEQDQRTVSAYVRRVLAAHVRERLARGIGLPTATPPREARP